jgi:hypothetical protein
MNYQHPIYIFLIKKSISGIFIFILCMPFVIKWKWPPYVLNLKLLFFPWSTMIFHLNNEIS